MKVGDYVKINTAELKKAKFYHPNWEKLVKKVIKNGNGKVYITNIHGDAIYVAESPSGAILGSVQIPKSAIIENKILPLKNKILIENTIVWFTGFNQISDGWMEVLSVINDNATIKKNFSDILNKFVLMMKRKNKPTPDIFKPMINDLFLKEYYKLGVKKNLINYNYSLFLKIVKQKNIQEKMKKFIYNAVGSDWNDDQFNIKRYITNTEAKKYLEQKSITRGKEKFNTMISNKGLK